jgi:hypothetical protein
LIQGVRTRGVNESNFGNIGNVYHGQGLQRVTLN